MMQTMRPGLDSYVHFTPLHPHTTMFPLLDGLLASKMDKYDRYPLGPLEKRISGADVIVYESNSALFLTWKCWRLAPRARHIYRVSDDIRTLRSTPPRMVALEKELAPKFSLISVPCVWLAQKFLELPNVRILPHGVDKEVFDACKTNPYVPGTTNAVFCGLGFYDACSTHAMAVHCPGINIHVVGLPAPKGDVPSNITYHDEIPFADTIPFIKYADCGLYTLLPSSRPMQAYTDSLKVMQYRYCGLPIVAPNFLDLHREGVFYYKPGDAASCRAALIGALQSGRNTAYAEEVHTWREVAEALL